MIFRDQAIVIRRSDWSETSQIVTLFTRGKGKVRAVAKGAHRPKSAFGGGIDMLTAGQGRFSQRPSADLAILTGWEVEQSFPGLRRSLPALNAGLYAAETVALTSADHDPAPEVFDLLIDHLTGLADGQDPTAGLLAWLSGLLIRIGSWPQFEQCTQCGKPAPPGSAALFSVAMGGVICQQCAARNKDLPRVMGRVRTLLIETGRVGTQSTDDQIDLSRPADILQAARILDRHLTALADRQPRMTRHCLK